VKIRGTKKMDRMGLIRTSRKFGIAPVFTAQLQQGKIVELPDDKAQALIDRGYAIQAQRRKTDDITVDELAVKTPETIINSDYELPDEETVEEDDDLQDEDPHIEL
jgi:hypothetical protein